MVRGLSVAAAVCVASFVATPATASSLISPVNIGWTFTFPYFAQTEAILDQTRDDHGMPPLAHGFTLAVYEGIRNGWMPMIEFSDRHAFSHTIGLAPSDPLDIRYRSNDVSLGLGHSFANTYWSAFGVGLCARLATWTLATRDERAESGTRWSKDVHAWYFALAPYLQAIVIPRSGWGIGPGFTVRVGYELKLAKNPDLAEFAAALGVPGGPYLERPGGLFVTVTMGVFAYSGG